MDEDAYTRLSEGWQLLAERIETLDFSDESQWGKPITDIDEFLRETLGARTGRSERITLNFRLFEGSPTRPRATSLINRSRIDMGL